MGIKYANTNGEIVVANKLTPKGRHNAFFGNIEIMGRFL